MRSKWAYLSMGLISLTCLTAACGGDGSDETGSSTEFEGRSACSAIGFSKTAKVANGELCAVDSADDTSSVVALTLLSRDGIGTCTGTVISPRAVLTAAHCFLGSPNQVLITTTVNGQQQQIAASRVAVHPGFGATDDGYFFNDAAVVLTSATIPAPASPILLARSPQVGEDAVVAGYGQLDNGEPASENINAGRASIRNVTNNHVFISYTEDEAHPCKGDSGGALFVRDGNDLAIVGVVSQSDPSVDVDTICRPGDETLYTNTQESAVSSFILGVVPDAATK